LGVRKSVVTVHRENVMMNRQFDPEQFVLMAGDARCRHRRVHPSKEGLKTAIQGASTLRLSNQSVGSMGRE
jgi:hypothetical protein